MKLEDYKKLVEIQLLTDNGLHNILEAKKAYQNNEIDKAFDNAKLFKPITDSNKELIDRIEKKTDQSDELIKKITDALPLYNQQPQAQEPLTYDDDKTIHEEVPKPTTSSNLDIDNEDKFIDNLINDKKVFLYTKKKVIKVKTFIQMLNY